MKGLLIAYALVIVGLSASILIGLWRLRKTPPDEGQPPQRATQALLGEEWDDAYDGEWDDLWP